MNDGFARLDQLCRAASERMKIAHLVTMRFRFQVHEIPVEAPDKELTPAELDALVDRFVERYEQIYGNNTALRGTGVEFNVLRAEAVTPVQKPVLSLLPKRDAAPKPLSRRSVYFYRLGFKETPVSVQRIWGPEPCCAGR